ncbi:proline dehydrogenase 1, mitochondrial-like [Neocloeon triangulifer]|uniref:proline dehydrogenase 1, mitochondrial-like n=1 Tax=Neocloeon triangulifer TaxID=2078957 RepID=UPI00286F4B07|nr:proline dehydrogenase 1, mitochondrial-like [Neocloeon triangulifer]
MTLAKIISKLFVLNYIKNTVACLSTSVGNAVPNFDNPRQAFKSKSTADLIRACSILALCSQDILVDNALKLMRAGEAILGLKIFKAVMQKTFYGQFVAGETGPAVIRTAENLRKQDLTLMVAPALESDVGEKSNYDLQDRNLNEYLKLAELTAQGNFGGMEKPACLQMKMTAVVPTELLINLSKIILEINEAQKLKIIEKFSNLMMGVKSDTIVPGLRDELQVELIKASERLMKIGLKTKEVGVRLLVDMEWTYVNPACSAFASALMKIFNSESPAVCSTIQCYLKGAMETIIWERKVAEYFQVCYGAKLVRGAYLEKELQVAPDLVCQSYEDTCNNYERVMTQALEIATKAAAEKHFIIVATHNEETVKIATRLLQKLQASDHVNVAFAQIYGMAENISLPLAQANYLVYKSVAFGSLHQVIPYLARRAAENRAIMKGARRERELMSNEIKRRILERST